MKKLWFFVPILLLAIVAGVWFFFLRDRVIVAPDYGAIVRESQKALAYLPEEGKVDLVVQTSGQGRKKDLGLIADPGLSLRSGGAVSNNQAFVGVRLSAGDETSSWSLLEDRKIFMQINDEIYDTRKKGAAFINPIPYMRPGLLLRLWQDLPSKSLDSERDGDYYKYLVKDNFYKDIQKVWPKNFLLDLEKNVDQVWLVFTKDSLPAGITISYNIESSDLSKLLGLGKRSTEVETVNLGMVYLVRSFGNQSYPLPGASKSVSQGENALGAELINFYSGLQ